MKLLSPFIF